MQKIEKIYVAISRTMDFIGGLIILPAIFFVVIVDVVLRYAFNSPFIWSLEFNEWMLLLLFMLAIPECTRQNGHIRTELLVASMTPRSQAFFDILYVFCGIGIFFLLGRRAWSEFLFNFRLNRVTEELQLPLWFHQLLIFAVCVVVIIYYLFRLIAGVLGLKQFPRTEASGMDD